MKSQLTGAFHIAKRKVSVIPFGFNTIVPNSDLTSTQARSRLGLKNEKALLFFGNIAPYKGLEYLLTALSVLTQTDIDFKLIIAGRVKKGCENYWEIQKKRIAKYKLNQHITHRFSKAVSCSLLIVSASRLLLPTSVH